MDSAEVVHRFHFAFTATFHYLFAHFTMGLALLILVLETMALRGRGELWRSSARFWTRIFAAGFVIGVATGIPLEFQFGTSWAELSRRAGGVFGQTLAMETLFAFFVESTFLGLVLFGEGRLSPRAHWACTLVLFLGTWASAYFIVATNAWMQSPVGYELAADGTIVLTSLGAMLTNPWALVMFSHAVLGGVVTASFVVASVGAWYLLTRRHEVYGRAFVRLGVLAGLPAAVLMAFPTGDWHGQLVLRDQPATVAAMEGLFETQEGAPIVLIGQPDVERGRLDNPIIVPRMLSFLTYRKWGAEVKGLDAFPRDEWPQNIPLLYYAYHVMVGLGTIFILVLGVSALRLRKGRIFASRRHLGVLLLALPFPFIANTAGWMTAELGRQPWAIHGLLRTRDAWSGNVSAGNALFTLIGFMGVYAVLALLFLFVVGRKVLRGPDHVPGLEA
jgi:cytochrome d ubiquinol oxidase subunit I